MKNRIVNFSNIYSSSKSKDQSRARSLSPSLGKSAKISHNTLNFKNFKERPKESISNLPNIDNYRGQTKLTFAQERAAQINKRLEIDSIIQKNFERRVKTNQMFIKPNNNPFTRFLDPSPVSSDIKPQVDVISQINKLGQSISLLNVKKRLACNISPLEQYIKDEQKSRSQMNRKGAQKQRFMAFQTEQKLPNNTYQQSQIKKLEQLVKIRQESFFNLKRRQRSWNIFQLINNKNHQDFKSNKQILTRYHFSRDSIFNVHLTQQKKYENYCLQQISSFSRQIVTTPHKKIKDLPQRFILIPGDMRVNIEKVQFYDLMQVARGRLTQIVLLRYLKEEDLTDKAKAQQQVQQNKKAKDTGIAYKQNTKNRAVNCGNDVQDRAQANIYNNNTIIGPLQVQQQALSNTFKQQYINLSKEEMHSLSNTVGDKQFLRQMEEKKNKMLLKQLDTNADIRIARIMKEVDRKIRMNKVCKNKTEKIKINLLTQTLKFRRNMESISPKKILGKNALLTWR